MPSDDAIVALVKSVETLEGGMTILDESAATVAKAIRLLLAPLAQEVERLRGDNRELRMQALADEGQARDLSAAGRLAGLREAAEVARGLPYSPPGWPDDGVVRYRTCPTWAAAGKDGHWSVPPQHHSYGKGREDAATAILALAGETTGGADG